MNVYAHELKRMIFIYVVYHLMSALCMALPIFIGIFLCEYRCSFRFGWNHLRLGINCAKMIGGRHRITMNSCCTIAIRHLYQMFDLQKYPGHRHYAVISRAFPKQTISYNAFITNVLEGGVQATLPAYPCLSL